ncbi:hypothetical protein Q7P37_009614 [Cladosporium fusiforme]
MAVTSSASAALDPTIELPMSFLTIGAPASTVVDDSKYECESSNSGEPKPSAVAKVLSTVELLELVLCKLPPGSLLKAQAICQTIKTAIETNPNLKEKTPPFLIDATIPGVLKMMYQPKRFTTSERALTIFPMPLCYCKYEIKFHFPVRGGKLATALLQGSSLARLQISHPPAMAAIFRYSCACRNQRIVHDGASGYSTHVLQLYPSTLELSTCQMIKNPKGIKFGELLMAVEKDLGNSCLCLTKSHESLICITANLLTMPRS